MTKPIRPEFDRTGSSKLLAYLRLMRLPNVFTAIADIAMGFLFVNQASDVPAQWPALALLVLGSTFLYTAGMVINDIWDLEVDRKERPFRPLPSGQISLGVAMRIGFLLLFNGVLLAAAAGFMHRANEATPWRSGIVAAVLALAILAYDGWLKHTPLGPLGMGLCRLLNVLLGMSAASIAVPSDEAIFSYHYSSWLVAAGMGVYIAGVTWFAKQEAGQSNRSTLTAATVVIFAGIALLASFVFIPHPMKLLLLTPEMGVLLFALLSLSIARRAFVAIQEPEPANVQSMVKHCILSIIVLNAAVALLIAGPIPGLAIAALMVPAFFLGRWVYST